MCSNRIVYETNRKFRDVNAWYHIVVAIDTTLATAGDRVRLYVNGVEETSFSTETHPAQNSPHMMTDNGTPIYIGSENGGNYFNGSMSHYHLIDGTQYTASDFGETDATTGEWKIKTSPSVTYGNNGFWILKDGNSVTDASPNTNNLTVSGGTLTKTEDCPSNVFATLNPLFKQDHAFSNGNLGYTSSASDWDSAPSTLGASSGKFYCEMKVTATASGTTRSVIGICDARDGNLVAESEFGLTSSTAGDNVGYTTGTVHKNNSDAGGTFASYTTNDIIGMYADLDNGKVYFAKNGVLQNSGVPTSGSTGTGAISITTGQTYLLGVTAYGGGASQSNFGNGYFGTTAVSSAGTNASGNGIFEYDVPTGYTALSTKGLNL